MTTTLDVFISSKMAELKPERDALYARLDDRVDRMLAEGLLPEVAALRATGYAPGLPAMQGIGYRHLVPVLEGGVPLADAVRRMKRDTRHYAKRQWTWFGRDARVRWVTMEGNDAGSALGSVKKLLERSGIFG